MLRRRRRRDVAEIDGNGDLDEVEAEVDENLTIEVITGLYVNEDEEVYRHTLSTVVIAFYIDIYLLRKFQFLVFV